jgi:hypothetical protein
MVDPGRVIWVVDGPQIPAHVASVRYTALIPARLLGGAVVAFGPDDDPDAVLRVRRPAAVVFSKMLSDAPMALFQAARGAGIPTIAAMCDLRFQFPYNRAAAQGADIVVVPCAAMADAIREEVGRPAVVIEDPYEGPRAAPRFAPGEILRLVWFAHRSNLETLVPCLGQLARVADRRLEIRFVTNAAPPAVGEIFARLPPPRSEVDCQLVPWSLENHWAELAAADIVLLPTLPERSMAVKGHNRLVLALNRGRFSLAHRLPAYEELAAFCWCGDDFAEGLEWALANPGEVAARIAAGQRAVDARFSPAAVAKRWTDVLAALG